MPYAGDPFIFGGSLPISHSPLQRISFNPQKPKIDPAALQAAQEQAIESFLELLDAQTGLDLVGWWKDTQTLLNFINAAQQQSWLNFQQFLNGLVQDIDVDVAGAIAYLNGIGQAADEAWTLVQDFLATGDWSDLSAAWTDLVQAIFGSSTSLGLVGSIPAPAVVDVVQNLQPVFDFPDVESVSAGAQWSWDGTHDHTGVAGSGSAKVVANGVLQALRGTPGAVQAGQVITASAWVSWSGLVASGSPIQLELIPSSRTGSTLFAGSPVTVASIASPTSSGSWTHLTGTYTVPPSGVNAVQLRLVVTGSATAGSVWWDDCEADVSGGFLADLQADTSDIIDSFAPGGTVGQFQAGVTNLLALFGLTPASVGGATVIDSVWTTVVNDVINPLNALEVQAANIIGQLEVSAINGLTSLLNALLPTNTYQSLVDGIANAFGHTGTGHTWSDIETYFGIIPPANVTNVLGGANLGADVSSVHSTASNASNWSTRLTNALLITSDVFHLTYQAGSTTDAPGHLGSNGKPTWYSAWNDLLSLAGVVNSTTAPTDAAPAVASAITTAQSTANTGVTNAATAQTAANTAQSTLNTTNTNLFGSTTPGTAIVTTAVPSGISATKISNVLGGANLGADVSTVSSTAINGTAWATRLTNDLTTLLDVFHVTYTVTQWNAAWTDLLALFGIVNSTSAPSNPTPTIGPSITAAQSSATTATTNAATAQSTANTAQSGLNTTNTNLFGSTTPASQITTGAVPSGIPATKISNVLGGANLGADVSAVNSSATTAGTNASTAISSAATAQTTANNGTAWSTRLTNDLLITSDVFHLTYAAGTSSDTPTTVWSGGGVGNGKRTWYSAWNDLLALAGVVNSTTAPADAAPTTGTVIQANTATANTASTNASIAIANASTANTLAQGTVDGLYQAFNGGTSTGNAVSTVKLGATAIPASNIVGQTGAAVTFGAVGAGNTTGVGSTSVTLTENHSILSTDLGVLAFVYYSGVSTATFTTTVTYGGVAMTRIGPAQESGSFSGGGALFLEVWWLKSPPTGAKTVSATVTRATGTGNVTSMALNSVSYLASKVASITAYSGGGSSTVSMTGTSVAGNMLVGAIAVGNAGSSLTQSSFSQTSRWSQVYFTDTGSAIGDANGAASVTFSETVNNPSTTQWVGYIVELSN